MADRLYTELTHDKAYNLADVLSASAARQNLGITNLGSGQIITESERTVVANALTGVANSGTEGVGVFSEVSSAIAQLRKLQAGDNVTISVNSTTGAIEISAVAGGDSHNLGWYADLAALQTAYPTGTNGDYAICGDEDAFYVWDSDTTAWVQTSTTATIATQIHNATAKGTLADNDEFALVDSEASNVIKKITWANIKSLISTFVGIILGTAAYEDVGTTAGDVVQLDTSAKLPAVDASNLTNVPYNPTSTSNGYGTRTVSTSDPSGGSNGDIWLKIES
jgi:hypothetical protein